MQLTDIIAAIAVSKTGYRWESNFESDQRERGRGGPGGGLVLVEQMLGAVGGDHNFYDPFVTAPACWLDFARLQPTGADILAFADRYGVLRADETVNLSDWQEAISRWTFAFRLWEAIERHKENRRHTGDLNEFVRWEKKPKGAPALFWLTPGNGEWVPAPGADEIDGHHFKPGELLAPAQNLLGALFQSRLYRQRPGQPVMPNVAVAILPDRRQTISVKFAVPNLIDVLWIQFAVAVSNGKQFRSCEVCGSAFELDDNRTDRVFCDDACRMKAYRRRRKTALEMHRLGKPLKEISSQVGSPIATVKRWLNQPEKR